MKKIAPLIVILILAAAAVSHAATYQAPPPGRSALQEQGDIFFDVRGWISQYFFKYNGYKRFDDQRIITLAPDFIDGDGNITLLGSLIAHQFRNSLREKDIYEVLDHHEVFNQFFDLNTIANINEKLNERIHEMYKTTAVIFGMVTEASDNVVKVNLQVIDARRFRIVKEFDLNIDRTRLLSAEHLPLMSEDILVKNRGEQYGKGILTIVVRQERDILKSTTEQKQLKVESKASGQFSRQGVQRGRTSDFQDQGSMESESVVSTFEEKSASKYPSNIKVMINGKGVDVSKKTAKVSLSPGTYEIDASFDEVILIGGNQMTGETIKNKMRITIERNDQVVLEMKLILPFSDDSKIEFNAWRSEVKQTEKGIDTKTIDMDVVK